MASVTLSSVSKRYGRGELVVDSIDLTIADGEFMVLVGASGCGKSTTLRMIAGLESITQGTIDIGGRTVNDVHPKDRDIAMVFQNYALYPHMTVEQNMGFALKIRKVPSAQIKERVATAAAMLGLTEYLQRKPVALSGGQRQRVAVGRALARDPAVYLFDEPLSNLDAKLRMSMRSELKALHQRLRTTTIYVTHDQEEAMTLGDRLAVMAQGRIQHVGPPTEVYAKPANRFVAGFVGTPSMNFLEGRIEQFPSGPAWIQSHASPEAALRVMLPSSAAEKLASATSNTSSGNTIIAGMRPQAVSRVIPSTADHQQSAEGSFQAQVLTIEPLGDQIDLRITTSSTSDAAPMLILRVPSRTDLKAGDLITVVPDTRQLAFFEAGEFGRRLFSMSELTAPQEAHR